MKSKTTIQLPNRIKKDRLEAGVDEVGRGCLAGPVVAAAVILPEDCSIEGLHDSKKLSALKREMLSVQIKEQAIAYAIGEISPAHIDRVNILQATFLAMTESIKGLLMAPEYLLIDGNRFHSTLEIPYETIVGGDDKVASIAAASILAKVYRDNMMKAYALDYPQYDWEHNMGYGTQKHLIAIQRYGISPLHRKSFGPCQPTLFTLK
ncbi:ribonuclease HII [Porphyromonadaceae bacterium W3.11]|nr:ribonuclease HII [Porphyromonadaceae bacterium W3.11]